MSLTPQAFEALIDAIAEANGLDRETAGYYAVQVGDTPMIDKNGHYIVTNKDGETVALKMP